MNREKSLAKNTIIITIGKICTQLITFFLLPLYTGILSTGEYGTVDLLNTLVSLFLPIVTLQIEQAMFRELIEVRNDDKKTKKIISSGVLTTFLQCILFLVICIIIFPYVNNDYKVFLATNVVSYIFLSLFQQIARGIGDNKNFTIGSFISAIFTIVFNIIFLVKLQLGATGMLLGTFFGQIIGILYLFIVLKIYKYISIKEYKKEILKSLLIYSIPLIPNAISWWVFNASDRVIATALLGVDQNGILAASLKFSTVFITIYNIFNMSWTESISMAINDADIKEYFNKMFNIMLRLFSAMAIGIIACMPFVFPVMINEKFGSGYNLVPISIIASLFNVVVGLLSVIYVAKKDTKAIANTSIISAIINIIIHLVLIKFVGLFAAVISTFAAFFIMSIYRFVDVRNKYFKVEIDLGYIIKTLVVLFIICSLYYINNLYLNIVSLLLAIIYAWYINKNSIGIILVFLKNKIKRT